jgi:hypothetical protein
MRRFVLILLLVPFAPAQTIKHVIFIVKENRSFDTMFGGLTLPGVSPTTSYNCYNGSAPQGGCSAAAGSQSSMVPIQANPTLADADCGHLHGNFVSDFHGGAMDKFNQNCGGASDWAKQYSSTSIPYYWTLATTYGLGAIQASAMAPTFPSHMLMFAGTTSETRDNPSELVSGAPHHGVGGAEWTVDTYHYGICNGGTNVNQICTTSTDCGGGTCLINQAAGHCCQQGVACDFSSAPVCVHGLNSDCATGFFCANGNVYGTTRGAQSTYNAIDLTGSAGAQGGNTGAGMYPGVCLNHRTVACVGVCAGPLPAECAASDAAPDPACTALSDTCDVGIGSQPAILSGSRGSVGVNVTTIADMLDTAGVKWGFYSGDSIRTTPAFYPHIWYGSDRKNVFDETPCPTIKGVPCTANIETAFDKAVASSSTCKPGQPCAADKLPSIVWLQAGAYLATAESQCPGTYGSSADEHPPSLMCIGEDWTHSKIAEVMGNAYLWNNTVIFVIWDDFGGFYDHVAPVVDPQDWRNGFRVPLLCVSKYCKKGYQDTGFVFESMLTTIENIFLRGSHLPGGLFDASANDLGLGCVCTGSNCTPNGSCNGHSGIGMLDLTLRNLPLGSNRQTFGASPNATPGATRVGPLIR